MIQIDEAKDRWQKIRVEKWSSIDKNIDKFSEIDESGLVFIDFIEDMINFLDCDLREGRW